MRLSGDLPADYLPPPPHTTPSEQAIETENMDTDDFAFLMRGAFASIISRNFDSNIGVSAKLEQREPRVIIPLLDILCVWLRV